MRHEPGLYNAYSLFQHIAAKGWGTQAHVQGRGYVPARPLSGDHGRFKMAWLVFTGRADVLHWPGQE